MGNGIQWPLKMASSLSKKLFTSKPFRRRRAKSWSCHAFTHSPLAVYAHKYLRERLLKLGLESFNAFVLFDSGKLDELLHTTFND